MSKTLKAASFAAIAMSTVAALSVTDMSFAYAGEGEVAKTSLAEVIADLTPEIASEEAEAGIESKNEDIVFAEPAEVVQQIPVETAESSQGEAESAKKATSLRQLVAMQNIPSALGKQQQCLAGTIYFESKGESLAGQLAVAKVVLARSESRRFPNSICGVVYQRSQFSFVRGGRMPRINTRSKAWRNAVAISQIALNDGWDSRVEGALFFHARYVKPRWRLKRMAQIDNHIFYR